MLRQMVRIDQSANWPANHLTVCIFSIHI